MDGWMELQFYSGRFQCIQHRHILVAHDRDIPFGLIAESVSAMARLNLPPTSATMWLRMAVMCEGFRTFR